MDDMTLRWPGSQHVPPLLDFLEEEFGITFEFADPECDEIEIGVRDIEDMELFAALQKYSVAIKQRLFYRHRNAMQVHVGGPKNGDYHGQYGNGKQIIYNVARGRWAVYVIGDDKLRAWFRGFATSQKNARAMKFVTAAPDRNSSEPT